MGFRFPGLPQIGVASKNSPCMRKTKFEPVMTDEIRVGSRRCAALLHAVTALLIIKVVTLPIGKKGSREVAGTAGGASHSCSLAMRQGMRAGRLRRMWGHCCCCALRVRVKDGGMESWTTPRWIGLRRCYCKYARKCGACRCGLLGRSAGPCEVFPFGFYLACNPNYPNKI